MMRCPRCSGLDDRVVDSRAADEGGAIRRRRECLSCASRFTTYERIEEVPFVVVKRSGQRQAFERRKIVQGLLAAAKNRPITEAAMEALAGEVEEELRLEATEVTSARVGRAVLARLARLDEVVYVRFASVYKGFTGVGDFERELGLLVKESAPKP
jgi:transcriptional repressor NrdR